MKNTSHGCPYEYSESMLWSVRRECARERDTCVNRCYLYDIVSVQGVLCTFCVHPQICKTALRVAGNVAEHERMARAAGRYLCCVFNVP